MNDDQVRDVLRIHHPIMRSETGPFSGCRCGQVKLGQDVIAHVVAKLMPVVRKIAADELRAAAEHTTTAVWPYPIVGAGDPTVSDWLRDRADALDGDSPRGQETGP